ncbi:MAG: HAMP domain-containing sensor histidine kinase [Acidobacteriota bacterium]
MIHTLRARLTLLNIGIVTVAVSLFALLLYGWLSRTLYAHHDQELGDDAGRIAEGLATAAEPIHSLEVLDLAERVGPLLIVRDGTGHTLFRSARLAASDPGIGEHTALLHAAMSGPTSAQFFTVSLQRGAPIRFICLPLSRPAGTYLQLGRRLGDVGLLLDVIRIASLVLIPLVVIATSFGARLIAGRALTPIAGIAATLESIQATDLSRHVSAGPADQEITRLSGAINHLLDRLRHAFASLQEFTADVSHQLLTPLTIMKGSIDVALSAPRQPAEYQQILADLAEEVDALTATLRDLSDFTVAGADTDAQMRERVDVSDVFQEAGELVRMYAEGNGVPLHLTIETGIFVWGSRIRLRQLVLNLGENAVQFTPPDGGVWVTLAHEGDRAVLTVRDEGSGIAAAELPRVFERRYTAGPRLRSGGSGLGLALVKRIVEAHRGTIDIESQSGAGTTVRVTLPAAITTHG